MPAEPSCRRQLGARPPARRARHRPTTTLLEHLAQLIAHHPTGPQPDPLTQYLPFSLLLEGRDRRTRRGIDVDEQPGFVIEGERVALGPLRMDLVPTYQRWENDPEAANANGLVIPLT